MKTKLLSIFLLTIGIGLLTALTPNNNDATKPFVVVLDAGHGGKDSGNTKNGYKEADIALNIVLGVGKILEKNPDIKVIYTRTKNVFLELSERAAIANKADADLFVSVHCNAHHTQAYGTETFVLGLHKSQANFEVAKKENEVIFLEDNYKETYAGFDPSHPESLIGLTLMQEEYLDQSILLASLIQNNFTNTLKRKDRSVKQAGFWVLHNTYMPSVLVETGFLSNTEEGKYLNSDKGQNEMANEIAKAILSYKNSLSMTTTKSQNPVMEDTEINKAIETTVEKHYKDVMFRVQLAATGKKLDTKPSNFKGLKDVNRAKEDGLYKYYYGETSDYNKIQIMKSFAQEKGYASCYIVAFKGDKKVKLSDVLNSKDK
ncbi:N-acetylmuramoyl-L-alanine amidase [Ulvibacter sp. MAR_2010_11]|uniref:N-acetylmuramoyl-L-alanine amidase family protein n=1 Tax=Ulvibacter sp. MAR_2010_11 TaxID=1250229 RepID=UPI000C2BBB86|nr:N-acetylmuramoyl-L-alanine amidase [Ulvibacter sp. MAR_2010_11]PKA84225.1 N-acetylmuramoyl-L-alanine amidase [Ulvibacter sp. MAR_2010_11]